MRVRLFFGQALLRGLLALAIFSYPILIIAQDAATVDRARFHTVHQRVDGNISGHVSEFAPSGTLEPVRAKISFVRNGKVVASVHSDEGGRFQATGLELGVCSVIAVSRTGFGVLAVSICPIDENTGKEQATVFPAGFSRQTSRSLDMTLIPARDFELLAKMFAKELGTFGAASPTASAAGGGGDESIGGDGFGNLLGVGGSAAAAAAGAATKKHHASPFTP